MGADILVGARGDSSRQNDLPCSPPNGKGGRSGVSIASTGRCSSQGSSCWSSAHSGISSKPCGMQSSSTGSVHSSRTSSTAHSASRPRENKCASRFASNDSTPANPHVKASLRDAVQDSGGDKALEVEKIDAHTRQPRRSPMEFLVLQPVISLAWQDPAEAGAERNCTIVAAASQPLSGSPSDLDDPIFGSALDDVPSNAFNDLTDFGDLDDVPRNPLNESVDFGERSLMTLAQPTSSWRTSQRPTGDRILAPVSLEAAEAALSAVINESAAGVAASRAVVPAIMEAWGPEQAHGPPPANSFTRAASRQRPSSSQVQGVHARLSL